MMPITQHVGKTLSFYNCRHYLCHDRPEQIVLSDLKGYKLGNINIFRQGMKEFTANNITHIQGVMKQFFPSLSQNELVKTLSEHLN